MAISILSASATRDSAESFNLTILAVYKAALEADPWRSSLALLGTYFHVADGAIIVPPSSASKPGYTVCLASGEAAMESAYCVKWRQFDPFPNLPKDCVMLASEVLTEAQRLPPPVFQDHDVLGGDARVMGVNFAIEGGSVIRLRLERCRHATPFCGQDKQRLAMLVPHIKQAMAHAMHIDCSRSQKLIYEEGLERLNIGVVVLDVCGRLLLANPTASRTLQNADGLKLVDRHLAAGTLAETRALQLLLLSAREHPKRVTAMCLSLASKRRKLVAVVRSIPLLREADGRSLPAVAIFFRDPDALTEPAYDIARQLFDFTPAEAQLAIELLNGLSLDEAVEKIGILRNTGRAHLRAIFSKTGVTRQSELVRVLLNGVLMLSAMDQ